jgi:hypothetical protein
MTSFRQNVTRRDAAARMARGGQSEQGYVLASKLPKDGGIHMTFAAGVLGRGLRANCALGCPRLPVSPSSLAADGAQLLSD